MTPQTVSLEVAKKLKKTGWEKNTFFEYDLPGYSGADYYPEARINSPIKQSYIRPKPVLPASMMHEILEELPGLIDGIEVKGRKTFLRLQIIKWEDGVYSVGYWDAKYELIKIVHTNPHDACTLLWIWLVENNYITPHNKR